MLLELGIPAHIKGFDYIHRALELLQEDKDTYMHLDRRLYPKLALEFNVTKKGVERGIHYAVEMVFDSISAETEEKFLGQETKLHLESSDLWRCWRCI